MSLSEQNLVALVRVLPGNTSITNFMDFRCGFADLEALLNTVRETAYKEGWNDREDDLIAGVNRIAPARAEGVAALQQRDVADLIAWHTRERHAWLNVRASNEPGYTEQMAKFHETAVSTLRGLHA